MNKLIKLEEIVTQVLESQPLTREDDFFLIHEVYKYLQPDVIGMPFGVVMVNHKGLNLPHFESIRRTRQKIQHDNENLKPPKKVQDARLNKTKEYIDYAIDFNYSPTLQNIRD